MEILHPGLYMLEVQGEVPVEGISTATGAFVGTAPRGKVGEAVLATSWTQFVKEYGGFDANSYLAYAVKGFFENGGSRAYIVRTVHYNLGAKTSESASIMLQDADIVPVNVMTIQAKSDGLWGNDISLVVEAGEGAGTYNINVLYKGSQVEQYVSLTSETVISVTATSAYIECIKLQDTIPVPIVATNLTGGNDGLEAISDSDYLGIEEYKNGLYALDSYRINLVAIPGITTSPVLQGVLTYVEGRGDCFAILDTPMAQTITGARTFVKATANLASEYAGIYYPWVIVPDPIGAGNNPLKTVAPSGHVMGAFARIDSSIGVWKAPAGLDAKLLGVVGLEYKMSDTEQGLLNPENINCIRSFDGQGIVIWGARTLSIGKFKYVPAKRTILFISDSLYTILQWAVFQPNNLALWDALKANTENFLSTMWAQGALKGKTAKEAFFVKCDADLNTADIVEAGYTYIDLGVALLKPSEFIIFRLTVMK